MITVTYKLTMNWIPVEFPLKNFLMTLKKISDILKISKRNRAQVLAVSSLQISGTTSLIK
jgi:hypothetical protein